MKSDKTTGNVKGVGVASDRQGDAAVLGVVVAVIFAVASASVVFALSDPSYELTID
jgi:hypothetical protein